MTLDSLSGTLSSDPMLRASLLDYYACILDTYVIWSTIQASVTVSKNND